MEKTEFAKEMIEDGQSIRSIFNYLSNTYDGIENVELFDAKFTDRETFYKFIIGVCNIMIEANKEEMLDNHIESNN